MARDDGPDELDDDGWDPLDDDPIDDDPIDDLDDGGFDDGWDDGWGDEPTAAVAGGAAGGGGAAVVDAADDGGWGEDPPAKGAALRLLVGVAVLLVGIGLIVALSKASDDDDDGDEVATDASSTSSTRRSTTTRDLALPGGPTSTVDEATSTTARRGSGGSSTSTTRRSTTTTVAPDGLPEPGCASGGGGPAIPASSDWATRWQTQPLPNDPAKVTICVDDVTPKVGQVVHLSLRGDDPDALIPNRQCSWLVTWEGAHDNPCQTVTVPSGGPHPTPLEEPGHVVVQLTHAYGTPGSKTIIGSVASTEGELSPYASYAESDLVITVHE